MGIKQLKIIIFFIVISVSGLSCATTTHIELLKNDNLELETIPSRGINI